MVAKVFRRIFRKFLGDNGETTESYSISTTAWGCVLELKLHEVPTTDSSQVHRVQVRLRFGVLELGRGVLELKLHEEESKYTEA